MGDIKQAARWLLEGKRVRRRSWEGNPANEEYRYTWEMGHAQMICQHATSFSKEWFPIFGTPADFLADDWEVAE
jgi:hypothetical protein